jgi:hypothetical protein
MTCFFYQVLVELAVKIVAWAKDVLNVCSFSSVVADYQFFLFPNPFVSFHMILWCTVYTWLFYPFFWLSIAELLWMMLIVSWGSGGHEKHGNSIRRGMWWSGGKAQWYPYVQFYVCVADGVLKEIKVRCSVLEVLHCDLIISCCSWTNLDIIFCSLVMLVSLGGFQNVVIVCRWLLPLLVDYWSVLTFYEISC